MNRRQVFIAATASLLGCACSSPTMRSASKVLDMTLSKQPAFPEDYPDTLPYASISVQIDNGRPSLLILGKIAGPDLHWFSADREVLVTRHGRIVQTVGLPENIDATEMMGRDFLEPGSPRMETYQRRIDIGQSRAFGIRIESRFREVNTSAQRVGSKELALTLIEEQCVSRDLNWQFINQYWLDTKHYCWRSKQTLGPSGKTLSFAVTKPYFNK